MHWYKQKVRRTTILSVALFYFLLSLAVARLRLSWPEHVSLAVVVGISGWLLSRRYKRRLFIACLFMVVFSMGLLQGGRYMNELSKYDSLYGKNVVVEITAREDAVYSERRQLIFSAGSVNVLHPNTDKLVGTIEVEGFGVPMVYRGDRIIAEGKLFAKRGDNKAGMSFAKLRTVASGKSPIDTLRRQFSVGLMNVLPEPLGSFALGLLIGQRNTLPKHVSEELITSGLIHIVAVSGYNVTIIINFAKRLLAKRSRYQALVGSIVLIGVFLLFTGSSPSIVRAAVVSILSVVTWYFGRNIKPVLLLLLAAAITAGANPLYLWSSIGWYLSFTAFFGVLVVAPLIQNRFLGRFRHKVLPQVFTETLSAQLCTLPIILYIFGRLSVVSIIANILVVPLVPFAMVASLPAGIYGMLHTQIMSWFFVLPAKLLLDYIIGMSRLFSTVPYANVSFKISALQMILLYMLLLFGVILLWKKRLKTAIISDKQ